MGLAKVKLLTVFLSFCIAPVLGGIDSNKTMDEITGQDLINMGNKYNKPFLMLIGKAIRDTECRTGACSPWTEWSTCEFFVGEFGMKERSRLCSDSCKPDSSVRNETETKICKVVVCPSGYGRVLGDFCLKVYTTSVTKNAAETTCRNDGGFLVNINSHKKWSALSSLLKKNNITSNHVYIDGQRKDNTSPWTFSYEDDITGYTNWADNDPDNGSSELCLIAYIGSPVGVYDTTCTHTRYFMCEILPSL